VAQQVRESQLADTAHHADGADAGTGDQKLSAIEFRHR
jgi:hypothetical protein